MTEMTDSEMWLEVSSPFCGIASDDLTIKVDGNTITVVENGDAVTKKDLKHQLPIPHRE